MEMNEKKSSITAVMESSMAKIREMVDSNTIVGEPITTPDGVTIIPVTKVSIGYGGGGSDFAMKNMPANRDNPFGGGAECRRRFAQSVLIRIEHIHHPGISFCRVRGFYASSAAFSASFAAFFSAK